MNFLRKSRSGFTLIELAIVLSVVGLMTVGLWRLLSSSNQQMKDSSTAGQQLQVINAAKAFLASSDGQGFLTAQCTSNCAIGKKLTLPLPLDANHAAGSAACYAAALGGMTVQQTQTWCTILPLGFSAATVNSYGQTYAIQIVYNSAATSTVAPPAYSFMVLTSGGDTIADTSGGRISSQIGGDGGFVYSNAVCGATTNSCGAYGAWYADPLGTYGFGASTGGHVASQTYYSAETNSTGPWLARLNIGSPGTYNTMFTTLYLGGNQITGNTGGTGDSSRINLTGPGALLGANSPISVANGCTNSMTSPGVSAPPNCPYSLNVTGDVNITSLLNANAVFTSSDIRLKKDIHPLTNTLDNIMQLKPVAFTFKSNGAETLGVIAQDLDKVYPQLVSHADEKLMKSVNYQGLIAPLIGAVQELKHENDELRQQLRADELREQKLEQKFKDKEN